MRLRTKYSLFLTGLLVLMLFGQCQVDNKESRTVQLESETLSNTNVPERFDTLIYAIQKQGKLFKEDILFLDIIDTAYVNSSNDVSYCDTTVQLNDSIMYTLISLSDGFGICDHTFIVTIDQNNRKAVSSKYLQPSCDVDFASSSYVLFDYRNLDKGNIELTKTTIFQKEKRVSESEEDNIDHRKTQISYFSILPSGIILSGDKPLNE